jgi:3-methylfumaryl-CoA hydratase
MLDLDADGLVDGAALPRGWQFVLLGADTRRAALRADGFPGLGVPMPDLGLPRLLLGGRGVAYLRDIPIGAMLTRTSAVKSLVEKTTDTGPMAIVTIEHALRTLAEPAPALVETQTYLLLPARDGALGEDEPVPLAQAPDETIVTVVPDETLLFQYSALGFNSHKIHIDKAYARDVEGYPDLVVNGGLATLLLTEFLRRELGVVVAALKVRHLAPLYCGRPVTLAARRDGAAWRVKAYNNAGRLAVDMEVSVQ